MFFLDIIVNFILHKLKSKHLFCLSFLYTVRPRDTRPQAARTSTVHDFELDQKKLEKHVFEQFYLRSTIFKFSFPIFLRCTFFDKFVLEKHGFLTCSCTYTMSIIFSKKFIQNIYIIIITKLSWKKVHAK